MAYLDVFVPVGTTLHGQCEPMDGLIRVADTRILQVFMLLRIDEEVLLLRTIDDDAGVVGVDRGVGGTKATGHNSGAPIDILGTATPESSSPLPFPICFGREE